ncbi:hypothetical protein QYE76_029643 [Lolium multiflorum]|uniref:Arabidopsis retrotransposon Orf1 C-terminal domain-containing protein n=1 Tax=Lolium multiflorum TaxID=4521 RepID=A0AAD8QN68_LOLMU|nr:hypothetical protein QYE76_029643 [Lolium multiflorum]
MAGNKNKKFQFQHCFFLLQHLPKWKLRNSEPKCKKEAMLSMDNEAEDMSARNKGKLEGSKKAKERMKVEGEAASFKEKLDQLMKSKEALTMKTLETKLLITEKKKEVKLAKVEARREDAKVKAELESRMLVLKEAKAMKELLAEEREIMMMRTDGMDEDQLAWWKETKADIMARKMLARQARAASVVGASLLKDPLYPEGHPKRVEQDSQLTKTSAPSKKKKKKHKNVVESSEPVNDPNSISISDAETESGNEHDKDNDKDDTPDKEEIEKEPEKPAKNKKYTKEDFIAEKHGAVIDCNKGMVTFNVDDKEHTVYFPKRIDKKRKMKKFKFGELFKKGTTSTGRPSRASTQIRRSYNEDIIAPSFAPEEDNGAPNASSFPCYDFLTNAGILDDFFTLVNRAGLATYVGDEREQYYRLTKIFVESFKFHNTQYEPTVAFKIYDNPVTMELEEFCRALDIVPVGTARRIDDNPRDLLELYRGITEDDCRTIQRGKIRNIQLPAIKYFAYYIATSILGRENTSNISSYHLAFLNAALTGETSYHLGSLIARRLSSRGPIFGGTIALRILTHLRLPLDSNDVPLTPRRLDIAAMKSHHFVTTDSTIDNMVYRMLFADGNEKEIPLPQPGLFNIDRQSWSLTKEEVEEHMKIQEFHQQHDSENAEPSYDLLPSKTPRRALVKQQEEPGSSQGRLVDPWHLVVPQIFWRASWRLLGRAT